ncbi:MAG: dihydropyrimidinase [Pelolinea sp.]|nr:dihydropyrimidinase [Pelolinea sp.]
MKTLIKGGTVITAAETILADILIEDEKIKAIGLDFSEEGITSVINALGKLVMPGGIDVHTHFDLPMFDTVSSDDHYTGHKAAAFGGTTSVIDFVSQDKETLKESVETWHKKADKKAAIDFSFHMNITHFDEKIAKEIPQLRELGINSVKVFTAYNHRLRLDDGYIIKVMRIAKESGILVLVHAENGDVIEVLVDEALRAGHTEPVWHARTRPTLGEVESVYRTIKLSELAESPVYIVHMNTKGGVDHVRDARQKRLPVMGETCPQYLFFTADYLLRPDGAKWICSPPVRSKEDNAGVWHAVEDGTMQVMATDHCPFFYDGTTPIEYEGVRIAIPGKELGKSDFTKIPNGLPGVGDRMLVMWTKGVVEGHISPNQFVQMMCTNPAKVFGLYPQKGTILPGSDADLAIWDPDREFTYGVKFSQQRTDYNLYEGWNLKGAIEKVFMRGKLIVDDQVWHGNRGGGRYIRRGEITVL